MGQTRHRFFAAATGVVAAATVLFGWAASGEAKSGGRASALDKEYLKSAIEGDRFEIEGGKLALRTSDDGAVRDLADRLVEDHTRSLQDATDEAHRLGVKVPGSPSPSQQWELDVLQTMKGAMFDKWYTSLEVQDHRQDIDEATTERDEGSDPRVVALARDELPTLRKHLSMSEDAAKSV
jgi:putative membrane protein